jgi:hypothetical protein
LAHLRLPTTVRRFKAARDPPVAMSSVAGEKSPRLEAVYGERRYAAASVVY